MLCFCLLYTYVYAKWKIYKTNRLLCINGFVFLNITVVECFQAFNMAGATIKLFRHVRKFYRMIGIYPPPKHHQHPFNVKNTFGLVSTILLLLSIFWHFLFEANSTDEYGKSFVAAISMLESSAYFVQNFLKLKCI